MISNAFNAAIRVGYFVRIPNVGDIANSSVISILTGSAVRHTVSRSEPHLLAIGSVIASSTPLSVVWGAGVIHPSHGVGGLVASNIYALRGHLSHSTLKKNGINSRDVPLGDPGYVLPGLLGIKRSVIPRYKVGLVCHYVDRYHPVLLRMMTEPDVIDLNVHAAPDVFLKNMAECEVVISTSLHGLVFAEALGIPSLWVKASEAIIGGEFKFQDWYSTTSLPQLAPHLLRSDDTAMKLANRAEIRESAINVESLKDAFPYHRLDELKDPERELFLSAEVCRANPTPVFLISYNRGDMLKNAITGIRRLSRPTEIIIHDNGSNDPRTIMILNELEQGGIKIFRCPPALTAEELDVRVNETLRDFFSNWGEPVRYVVGDCQIDLTVADPLILDVFDELLSKFRQIECVGPMLRIRDIPQSYPLKNHVMNRHIEQFWKQAPIFSQLSTCEVAVLEAPIDTTFALHRAGEPFKLVKKGMRVYEPFEALDLDWYRNTTCEEHFDVPNLEISRSNDEFESFHDQNASLDYSEFFAVRKNSTGKLEVYTEYVNSLKVNF